MRKASCMVFAVLLSVVFLGGCDSQEAVGPAAGAANQVDVNTPEYQQLMKQATGALPKSKTGHGANGK